MTMLKGAILLVEDNVNDEALTIRSLKKNNILNPVVIAHDGVEAIDFLFGRTGETNHFGGFDLPAIVLLDLRLPKLDGLQVLRAIRSDERTRMLPVIILTSSAEDEDIIQSYALGVNSYVRKPVDFDQFVHAVGLLGVYWMLVNQPANS